MSRSIHQATHGGAAPWKACGEGPGVTDIDFNENVVRARREQARAVHRALGRATRAVGDGLHALWAWLWAGRGGRRHGGERPRPDGGMQA